MTNRLPWKNVIGYSFGDIANNFAFAMGAMFLLSYYTDVAGVGATAAGALLLGVRLFDALADVCAGRIVDSVNTRFGKFRPFLLFASVPLMIMSVLVFCVPADISHSAKVVYATVTYAALGFFYSLVNIPYGSLATAMTQDPVSRTRLGSARSIAAAMTFVVLAFVIAPAISGSDPAGIQSTYITYTICLGIIGYILYVICFKCTAENVVRTDAQPSLKKSLKTIRANHALMMLCGGALCMLAATFTVSASGIFYVRYVVGDSTLFPVLIVIQNLIGTVLPAPFVPVLVRRFGKKVTFLLGCTIAFTGYILFFFAALYSFWLAIVPLCLASVGMGVSMTVMWALEADTVEYGEYKTGTRIEGLTYSLFSLTRKCGQAVGGSIPAFILSLCGYVANVEQTDTVLTGICASIALVPAAAIALSFVIMCFYPLTDKYFAEIMLELNRRHAFAGTKKAEEQSA